MDNFKIIAIRTGEMKPTRATRKRNSQVLDPLRNLKENQIYTFRNEYKFPKNDFSEVDYYPEKEINLYKLQTSINNIPININAIVGSNGSGKSTLIELLYWANYNIGSSLNILEDENGNKKKPFSFLDFELLYALDNDIILKLGFNHGKVFKQKYKRYGNSFIYLGAKREIENIKDLTEFFYTIVVNYSHYALNSAEIGDWIIPLFNKSDGYQTPIVLNPMRIRGDIDINKEKYLLTRRLIANILEPVVQGQEKTSLRNIVNDKVAAVLELSYNPNPNANLEEPINPTVRNKLINAFKQYFKFEISEKQLENDLFVNVTLSYIHKKLIKMTEYKTYRKYRDHNSKTPAIKDINAYIKRIHASNSHLIFKVKGAILYLKYYQKLLPNFLFKEPFSITVDEMSENIIEISKSEPFLVNTYMMAPPSYLYTNIIPADGTPFGSLSSGEKQKIHSISSIVYHLINLNSVEQLKEHLKDKSDDSDNLIHYNYINIVLDEIELYYHPEWQRTYIADLINYIGKINSENLKHVRGLNITFLTHSPYILSDIPDTYVLKLLKGSPESQKEEEKTFGSNIHDLLANDFFMKNGFMGEFARTQIDKLINEIKPLDHISKQEYEQKFKRRIEIIGEPFIQAKVLELVASKTDNNLIDSIIEQRNNEIERLRMLKNRNRND